MSFLIKKISAVLQSQQPNFTHDWFSSNIDNWQNLLKHFKHKPRLRFLEIGCFEGRSTIWLLENILTHRSSEIFCIDNFGGKKQKNLTIDMKEVQKKFLQNTKPYKNKIRVFIDESQSVLRNLNIFQFNHFDFIYIDGSHRACHVLEDAILSFPLLKENGILIFDDYLWNKHEQLHLNPKIAIDSWLDCFVGQYEIIHFDWQLAIKKVSSCI